VGALPRPDVPPGDQRDMVDALHRLHHEAGWPSLRTLAREVGCSPTTVSAVFSSPRLPTWGVLELLVECMGGDVAQFHRLWVAASSRSEPGATPRPLIAGRRAELPAVRRHLETGTGLLLITGEAGIGKTKLVTTAAALATNPTFIAAGSCLPLSCEVPLLPIADALGEAYEVDDGQWVKEALADCPPYVTGSLRRLLPPLDQTVDAPVQPDDEWSGQRLFTAVGAVLTALGALRPLAVLVEDLHWADSATLDLLEHLLARSRAVSLVGTWRLGDPSTPGAAVDWLARVRRLHSVTELPLGLLDRDETTEQLDLLGFGPIDPADVDRIYRRSQGQPLFTEQLAAHAGEGGTLPERLADLLDRRLDGLDAPAWTIARVLGVADRSLSDGLLGGVTELSVTDLATGLHELMDRRLLQPPSGHDVQLRHPLLAEAIRFRLLPTETADEHRRLAGALAAATDPSAAEIAIHWQGAEDTDHELSWRIAAARQAASHFAQRDEARQWRRVLELWPPGATEVGSPPITLLRVYAAAIDALVLLDVQEAHELVDEGLDAVDDPDCLDAAALYERAADVLSWMGDPVAARELVDRALLIHRRHPPSVDHVRALNRLDGVLDRLGRHADASAANAEAIRVCTGLGSPRVFRAVLIRQGLHRFDAGDLNGSLSIFARAGSMTLPDLDPLGDIDLAVGHTMVLLVAGRSADMIADAGRPGLNSADAWGIDNAAVAFTRANVAAGLRLAGRVADAAAIIDPVTDEVPNRDRAAAHHARAILDALRGRCDDAQARHLALEHFPDAHVGNRVENAETQATAELWCGRADAALTRLEAVITEAQDDDVAGCLPGALALAARAEADLADAAREGSSARQDRLEDLEVMRARCRVDPFAPAGELAARTGQIHTWHAELARLLGKQTVEMWVAAASEWDTVTRPHDSAYCRWRGAEIALATGQATLAHRLLNRAARDAREHVPLLAAIRRTVGRD
jgi:tetratricopeptide (TPR) repeat protein